MLSYVEVVTTPTADTPGTLLLLHFDSRRYLIGNVAEGAQRACIERGVGLKKVSKILLTGRTEWSNLGGLLGMILSLADTKISSLKSTAENQSSTMQKSAENIQDTQVDVYGSLNLNHMIATSRRFIFRTGMPINAVECSPTPTSNASLAEPTWQDDLVKVWSMSISPSTSSNGMRSPRKRTIDEVDDDATIELPASSPASTPFQDPFLDMRKSVVEQMFSSAWKYDNLVPQPLSSVKMPAKVYVRDHDTKSLLPYTGPLPGGPDPVPDITVYVREPWPGARTENLPPTKPAPESVSYIIKNHPQRGKFLPQKAIELKVPKGKCWSELTRGIAVENEDGETITPDRVLAPGKEGGGCAIIDLPSIEYLEPLLQRPEWQSKEVTAGVEAVVWILGPGVANDPRLQQFQSTHSHLKHIVSSPDCCPNNIALDGAARNALRHNHIDKTIFPSIQHSTTSKMSSTPATTVAQRGLRFVLEPNFEVQDKFVQPPMDIAAFKRQVSEEFKNLEQAPLRLETKASDDEVNGWKQACSHPEAEVIVLGTGSSHPSRARNVSGTLVRVPGCGSFLLDCGEGTLGTLRRIYTAEQLDEIFRDLRMVWISHMHADHHLGLASVIRTWHVATSTAPHGSTDELSAQLGVVSDAPMLQWLHEYSTAEDLGMARVLPLATSPSSKSSLGDKQGTRLRLVLPAESEDRDMRITSDFLNTLNLESLNSVFVSHCKGAQAVSFTTKTGLKISYSGDCRPSSDFARIGQNSHLLIHEATFEDEMRGEALAKKHSTAGEALFVAHEMKAKACLLTHFSQRYPEMPKLGAAAPSAPGTVKESATVLEQDASADEDMPASMGGTENNPATPTPGTTTATTKSATLQRATSADFEVIDQQTVQKILTESGLRVIFAFDYMRIRLGDIPLLEMKQPLLREMYDKGIGKEAGDEEDGDAMDTSNDPATIQAVKQKQKDQKKKEKQAVIAKNQKEKAERSERNRQKHRNGQQKDGPQA